MNSIRLSAKYLIGGAALLGGTIVSDQVKADSYVVQAGESFASIAESYGLAPETVAANNGMTLADTIHPGNVIDVPVASTESNYASYQSAWQAPTSGQSTYVVQAGDTLNTIANQFNISIEQLVVQNNISDVNYIYIGQTLWVDSTQGSKTQASDETYAFGQCTYGVKNYFGDLVPNYLGDARDWGVNASQMGYLVDNNPVAGATIAVFPPGAEGADPVYGHVAVVADVYADQILILEMNGRAGFNQWNYRVVDKNQAVYIHI